MIDDLKCPLCGRYMIWYKDTLLCTKCDTYEIYDLNPNTMCPDFEKKYKRKDK